MTPDMKRRLQTWIGTLEGMYHFDVHPQRDTRNLRQNSFYWACVVAPYYEWLKEQGTEDIVTEYDAHEELRKRLLGDKPVFSKKTGAILTHHRVSTTELDKPKFFEYVERCRDVLARDCNIIVPDPNPYFHDEPKKLTA